MTALGQSRGPGQHCRGGRRPRAPAKFWENAGPPGSPPISQIGRWRPPHHYSGRLI